MAKKRRSYPKSPNIKYKIDAKDKTIFEDNVSPNVKFKIINDKNEPFYKHTFNRGSEKDGPHNN